MFTKIAAKNTNFENKQYFLDEEQTIFHREDGPAVEYIDGTNLYYKFGKLHREDGPAIEHPDGTKEYYIAGIRHRLDGHAIEYSDGTGVYILRGKYFDNKNVYKKAVAKFRLGSFI